MKDIINITSDQSLIEKGEDASLWEKVNKVGGSQIIPP